MTIITLDDQIAQEKKLLNDTRDALVGLRDDIREISEKIAEGDNQAAAGSAAEIKKVVALFNSALETENRLGELKSRKAGIAQNAVAFDLERARIEIGSKLDRLRNAGVAK